METKIFGFDIETAAFDTEVGYRGEGITAIGYGYFRNGNVNNVAYVLDGGMAHLSADDINGFLTIASEAQANGYTVTSWNGLGFDFRCLMVDGGDPLLLRSLVLAHSDIMFSFFMTKGFPVGLDAVSRGFNLPGKKHEVTLNDGSTFSEMSGEHAPKLWEDGEYTAVLDYLHEDVVQLLLVAEKVSVFHSVRWITKGGKSTECKMKGGLEPVSRALLRTLPYQGWMTDPFTVEKFAGWLDGVGDE